MNSLKRIMRIFIFGAFLLCAACTSNTLISADNINSLTSTQELQFAEATTAKWTLDGKAFWLEGLRTATLYNSKTLQETASYDVGEYGALYDTSPDGRLIAYALDEPSVILFDVVDQQEVARIPQDVFTQQTAFSTDGSMLGTASSDIWEITLWDVATAQATQTLTGFETAAPVYSFQFGADGKTILWIARATIQPMDIESAQLGPEISHEDFISSSVLSPDGKLLATSAAGTVDGEFKPIVTIWDAHSGEALVVFSNADYFSSLAFSPDGSLLAAGNNGKVLFWDVSNYQAIGEINTHAGYVDSVQFSPDGTHLLTCTTEGSVQMWQVE
ncbi:MAG: WD40 repeat domain-containing protein [Anaerolineaceae bacterium]